ncbi:hypothetical protein DOZ91_07165 [Peribacillus frigoritolerans]|nr:hypothetical protein DOZ91_07165 [Peribacillus frigoritolerans]
MKIVAFIVVAYLIQLKGIYFNKGLLRQPLIEVKVGFNMNIGDLIFQLVFLIFIFGIFSGVFFSCSFSRY